MAKTKLVLLPGLLNDHRLWTHQLETLADLADATVGDITGADSIAALAKSVLAKAPGRFALAGLSMGGYTALEIMRQAPERVERLALLDTSARPDAPAQTERRQEFIAQIQQGDFKGVTNRLLPLLIHPERVKDAALTDTIKAMALAVGKEAFIRQQTAIMHRADSRPMLRSIRCPTLVLCGRQDALTPLEVHQEMAAGIKGSALVVVEDCGHLSPIERPRAVSAVLRYWLQQPAARE